MAMREVSKIPAKSAAPDAFYDELFNGKAWKMSQKDVGPSYQKFKSKVYYNARKRKVSVSVQKIEGVVYVQAPSKG